MQRFKDFLSESSLHVFDIDDTLFHTTAKVNVTKDGKHVAALSNAEYNSHKLPKGHKYDFSEFRSAEKFSSESKPVHRMLNKLKAIHGKVKDRPNSKVILNTARADFDDKDTFLDKFRKHGVDIDNIHVHRSGNDQTPGLSVAEKKTQVIRDHLSTGKFKHVSLYDDSKQNLKHFMNLKNEHPNVTLRAYHVQPDGSIKKHEE
jgi:hypothetical protein